MKTTDIQVVLSYRKKPSRKEPSPVWVWTAWAHADNQRGVVKVITQYNNEKRAFERELEYRLEVGLLDPRGAGTVIPVPQIL